MKRIYSFTNHLQHVLPFQKQKTRAEGYKEGDYTLFKTVKVSDFVQTDHPLDVLSSVNEVCWEGSVFIVSSA